MSSGFGYSIGWHSAAGGASRGPPAGGAASTARRAAAGSSHCSMPSSALPISRPFLNHGLKLRVRCSSSCSQRRLERLRIGGELVALAARPASAANAASAASMPVLIAAWLPLMRGALSESRVAADQRAAREHELGQRLQAAVVDRARAVGDALAAFEDARGWPDASSSAGTPRTGSGTGSCSRGRRRSRARPGCLRGGTGSRRRRCRRSSGQPARVQHEAGLWPCRRRSPTAP